MKEDVRNQLNMLYRPLDHKARKLTAKLVKLHGGFRVTLGFYNGHYHKDAKGNFQEDAYPIPVISVKGLCDIEIDIDSITFTAKLQKDQLLSLAWSELNGTRFEVYGVEDYLCDYGNDQELSQINHRILSSKEAEFFVSFLFPPDQSGDDAIGFLKQLHRLGFYY